MRASEPQVRRRMQNTPARDNPHELELRSALHRRGLRFRVHRRVLDGSTREIDIAFVAGKIAVFVDGCFWHGCPFHGTSPKTNAEWWRQKIERNRQRDRDTDRRLEVSGWHVLRVWEHEPIETAADRIDAVVQRARSMRRNAK